MMVFREGATRLLSRLITFSLRSFSASRRGKRTSPSGVSVSGVQGVRRARRTG